MRNQEKLKEYRKSYWIRNKERITQLRKGYVAEYDHNYREKRKKQSLCIRCGSSLTTEDKNKNHVMCPLCRQKAREYNRQLRVQRQNQNLCTACGKLATVRKKDYLCEDCWFKEISRMRTGSRQNWVYIKELLEKQNHLCAYTGQELILGENASLDHILPTVKGGDNSIENLQWVDLQINFMKNKFSHQEFLSIIKLISDRNTSLDVGVKSD